MDLLVESDLSDGYTDYDAFTESERKFFRITCLWSLICPTGAPTEEPI